MIFIVSGGSFVCKAGGKWFLEVTQEILETLQQAIFNLFLKKSRQLMTNYSPLLWTSLPFNFQVTVGAGLPVTAQFTLASSPWIPYCSSGAVAVMGTENKVN